MKHYTIPAGKKNYKVTVCNGMMTGDTYPVKDTIKKFFGGVWNKDNKAWLINEKDLARWVGIKIHPVDDDSPIPKNETKSSGYSNNLCPKCQSYCYGDCSM